MCKQYLQKYYNTKLSVNQEADDDVCIEAFKDPTQSCLIVHIDKDLNQIPGSHYNFRKKEFYNISEKEAQDFFFHQMILGDKVDNVKGFDGKIRKEYPIKLQWIKEEIQKRSFEDNVDLVKDLYADEERFNDTADCIWLLKEENKNWKKLQKTEPS